MIQGVKVNLILKWEPLRTPVSLEVLQLEYSGLAQLIVCIKYECELNFRYGGL